MSDEEFEELMTRTEYAALLCWHRLHGWLAIRAMERQWPPLRLVPMPEEP